MLPISPMTELTLMIRPVPRSSMWASAACDRKKAPDRLTSRTLCQSSSVSLSTVLSMVIPALLIKMSNRPCRSITSATTRRQSSAEATLPWWTEIGVENRLRNDAANSSARSMLPLREKGTAARCTNVLDRHTKIIWES
jgi:hypothetical protein